MADDLYLHLVRPDCPLPAGTHVVAYCRDSGGEEQDRSVHQQIRAIYEYCHFHQLVLEKTYFDEAKTASNSENRDQLTALLADLRHRFKEIKDRYRRDKLTVKRPFGVLFWKSNRLSRDLVEITFIKADLRMRALTIVDLINRADTGDAATNALIEAFQAWQDQNLLDEISDNVKRGLADIVGLRDNDPDFRKWNPDWPTSDGRYVGIFPGIPATGFKIEMVQIGVRERKRKTASGEYEPHIIQRLVPDHDDGLWERCKLAWKMRHEGQTLGEIHKATHLFTSRNSFTTFFRNLIYTGTMVYSGRLYKDFVPAMIPYEWWEAEQQRRAARAAKTRGQETDPDLEPRRIASRHPLSGLVRCGAIDGEEHPMNASSRPPREGVRKNRYDYFACSVKLNSRGERCQGKTFSGAALQQAVLEILSKQVLTYENLCPKAQQLGQLLQSEHDTLNAQIAELQQTLDNVRSTIKKLVDAIEQGETSANLISRLGQREAEERDLVSRLAMLEVHRMQALEVPQVDDEQLRAGIDTLRSAVLGQDVEEVRRTLQTFVTRIVVKNKTGTLYYTFPFKVLGRIRTVPPRGFQPISCSTPSMASLHIVLHVYLGILMPKTPISNKTPRQLTRNETIRQRIAAGHLVADLACEFGISVQRIHQILRGRRK